MLRVVFDMQEKSRNFFFLLQDFSFLLELFGTNLFLFKSKHSITRIFLFFFNTGTLEYISKNK